MARNSRPSIDALMGWIAFIVLMVVLSFFIHSDTTRLAMRIMAGIGVLKVILWFQRRAKSEDSRAESSEPQSKQFPLWLKLLINALLFMLGVVLVLIFVL